MVLSVVETEQSYDLRPRPHVVLEHAFRAFPETAEVMDSNISIILRAEDVRNTLVSQLDQIQKLHKSDNPQVALLYSFEEKMRTFAVNELTKRYGDGIVKIKELETEIAALKAVPSLGKTDGIQSLTRSLRAYKSHRTKHQRSINATDALSADEVYTYESLRNIYPKYTFRHEETIKKRITAVDAITRKAIKNMRTTPMVRSTHVFGRLDGRSSIPYQLQEGKRAHDAMFLFWNLPQEVSAARAIVRHETEALVRAGQWNVLGGNEFSELLSMYRYSFGQQFVTEVRQEIASTVTHMIRKLESGTARIHQKRGMYHVEYPLYQPHSTPLTPYEVDGVFSLMHAIEAYTLQVQQKDQEHERTDIAYRQLNKLFYLYRRLVSESGRRPLAWSLLSIPGLSIDAVEDLMYRFGTDEHRSGMGYIGRLPMIASTLAQKSQRFHDIMSRAKNRDLHAWPYPPKHPVVEPHVEAKPKVAFSIEDQWRSVTNTLKELIQLQHPEILQLLSKITQSKDKNPSDVISLLQITLDAMPSDIRQAVFSLGQYDLARQLAGQFLANPDAFVAPAKKRSPEGEVYSTYVVVYQNPLTSSSSYDGKH